MRYKLQADLATGGCASSSKNFDSPLRKRRSVECNRSCLHKRPTERTLRVGTGYLVGLPFKGIIWSLKRKKSVSFFCGQRYSWTNVLRIGLLARAYALIFRNQNPACTIKKRKGKLLSIIYWLEFQFGIRMDSSIDRAALLH